MTDGRVGESSQSFKVVLPDVNVPLSEHWQRFVAEQVRSGRFPSEAAILEKALAAPLSSRNAHFAPAALNPARLSLAGERYVPSPLTTETSNEEDCIQSAWK